jgi:hypothetical protein
MTYRIAMCRSRSVQSDSKCTAVNVLDENDVSDSRLLLCSSRIEANFKVVVQALRLIDLYARKGVDKERLYIKVCDTCVLITMCCMHPHVVGYSLPVIQEVW